MAGGFLNTTYFVSRLASTTPSILLHWLTGTRSDLSSRRGSHLLWCTTLVAGRTTGRGGSLP